MTKEKVLAFPKAPGDAVDLLYTLRDERIAQEKIIKAKKEQEDALEEWIRQKLDELKLTSIRGRLATFSLGKPVKQPKVIDWEKFHAYISRNKAWELLQRRTSVTALRERWEAKKVVPGVEWYEEIPSSLTKAGG